jgi:glycosyltransferase involved in cell wall biosynthesis
MPIQTNPATGKPYKVLIFGDVVVPSGFGRISNEVGRRLRARGYDVQAAGISYSGWPHDLPFWVWPLVGQDIWGGLVGIVNQYQPDLLLSIQDFPYHHNIWNACRIDFSKTRWVWITPIDGTPVHPDWVTLTDHADGAMVISRFGVEAMRQQGKRVDLCHPGVDAGEFYPVDVAEKAALRAKAGLPDSDYLIGVMAMNQGRKAISKMIEAFHEFARDKPNARLLLDMDKVGAAGWDIPNLCRQLGWTADEAKRITYKEDLFKLSAETFHPLRNRYGLLDAHMVISHREGFGLPLLESLACRLPTLALDWCSGPEIVGEGRGLVVKRLDYMEHGAWGGARDAFPDMADFVSKLNLLYHNPAQAQALAEAGYQWARAQTWDVAADQVEAVIVRALKRARSERTPEPHEPTQPVTTRLSDTYGPGETSAQPPVYSDPGLRPSGGSDQAAEIPGGDSGGAGAGGPAANPGAGRRLARRKPGRAAGAAGHPGTQPE